VTAAAVLDGPDPVAFVSEEEGVCTLDLAVRGAHCAGCIARIEDGLKRDDRVRNARLNLSTGRLSLRWAGDPGAARAFVERLSALGYPATPYEPESEADPQGEEEKRLLWAMAVAGFAMANVMLLSVSVWAGVEEMTETMKQFIHRVSAVIVLPAVAFAGRPFFTSAWRALSNRQVNMDVPISLAVFLACGLSVYEMLIGAGDTYFDAAAMLLFFLLIGRFLDQRLRARASQAARSLAAMQVASANRLDADGRLEAIPAREVEPGDRLVLAPGDRVPVDAEIEAGEGAIDTSLVTGETVPMTVKPGSRLYSGMLNIDAALTVKALARREDSLLAEITRLVEAGEQGRSRQVRLADMAARVYVPLVHGLAALTVVGWLLVGGDPRSAIVNAIAVLIITCPCALGLAVPAVQVVACGRLFKSGILVKSGDALERLAAIDMAVFDKTGTLTEGRPVWRPDAASEAALADAALLARTSRHPLSRAIADTAGMGPVADTVEEIAGGGLTCEAEGRTFRLGSARWIGVEGGAADDHMEVWFQAGEEEPVRFAFGDAARPDAGDLMTRLQADGLDVAILSGDREGPVKTLAETLGVEHWSAGLKPQDKIARLEQLKAEGRRPAMIGDGVNDAPALAAAHVSISLASASEISQAAADLVIQGEHLAPVREAWDVAKKAKRRVLENFGLAAGYNAIAVPLAVFGFVTPLVAAIAMSASSLLVTLNALRLAHRGKNA
jgi:Cu2+-exporting ATPase